MKYQYLPIYACVMALATSFILGYTPLLLSCIFLLASVLTYIAYSVDKSAAIEGRWRVSEITLHFGALFCGWPGAIIAQQRLRHKTKKIEFRSVFWATVAINCALIYWLHTRHGMPLLVTVVSTIERFLQLLLGPGQTSEIVLMLTRFHT